MIDVDGRKFTGGAVSFPAEYGYHEFCRDEESVRIEGFRLIKVIRKVWMKCWKLETMYNELPAPKKKK